ncbi:hypothetical protein [Streptomyces yangpuensis]|uniref:hypothetical protein n=1 Tax=Streptomyces yangpuensis TaxID=1648182 RepID=UPI0037220331
MRNPHAVALLAVAPAFVLIACSPQSTGTGKPASTTPAAPATVASAVPAPARSDFVVETPQGPPATVPRMVGKNLQAAQDEAGAASLSFRSDDALGQNRIQVGAQDWKVCSQIPAAGMRLATGGRLVLSTVKVEETCP